MSKTEAETTAALFHLVSIQTPPNGIQEKLKIAAKEQRPLIVKLGFDPTAPDLHLGHAVVLKKMRQFQDAGHKVVIIIGDFTARIGDPTGRNKMRPPLTEEEVALNARTYIDQLSKIVDMDPSKLDIRPNSEWLGKMVFADVVKLVAKTTVAQILQREDFNSRYTNNVPIGMHEMLYPLMQGYDSIAINADIEMGGTDQLFNCLVGRALQESDGGVGQTVVSMPLLVGLDGKEKMSKSKNNYIGLTDTPNEMFGKTMSMPDELIPNYFDLATDLPIVEIEALKAKLQSGELHPMEAKKLIAKNIITQYHSKEEAEKAADYFYKQFQQKIDDEMEYVAVEAKAVFGGESSLKIADLCSRLQPDLSKSQARRLIEAKAVSLEGEKVSDPMQSVSCPSNGEIRVRIGKRGFFAIKV